MSHVSQAELVCRVAEERRQPLSVSVQRAFMSLPVSCQVRYPWVARALATGFCMANVPSGARPASNFPGSNMGASYNVPSSSMIAEVGASQMMGLSASMTLQAPAVDDLRNQTVREEEGLCMLGNDFDERTGRTVFTDGCVGIQDAYAAQNASAIRANAQEPEGSVTVSYSATAVGLHSCCS